MEDSKYHLAEFKITLMPTVLCFFLLQMDYFCIFISIFYIVNNYSTPCNIFIISHSFCKSQLSFCFCLSSGCAGCCTDLDMVTVEHSKIDLSQGSTSDQFTSISFWLTLCFLCGISYMILNITLTQY